MTLDKLVGLSQVQFAVCEIGIIVLYHRVVMRIKQHNACGSFPLGLAHGKWLGIILVLTRLSWLFLPIVNFHKIHIKLYD